MSITHNHSGKNWRDIKEAEFALRMEQEASKRPKVDDSNPELTEKRRRAEKHLERNSDDLADLGW